MGLESPNGPRLVEIISYHHGCKPRQISVTNFKCLGLSGLGNGRS